MSIILLLFIIGITIIILNFLLFEKKSSCVPTKVIYNFVPRTQKDNIDNKIPEHISEELSKQLFDETSPWVDRVNNRRSGLNTENINLYYISQF